ncbi:MAG: hypothetical protein AB7I41_16605 [Candidatus Sericytochromatia bacterium]
MKRLQIKAFSLILGCCSLWACQPMGLNQARNPFSALRPALQGIQNYLFQVQSGFQIAAVDADDAPLIEPVQQQFEADLKAGKLANYQQAKAFSIQLLAGSEGNYFTSPELVQALNQRVLATLVVMLPEQKTAVFKGEFENQRFYFSDPSQELALASASKAYLMTADANFAIQTYKGEILPETQTPTAEPQVAAPVSANAVSASGALSSEEADFDAERAEAWEAGERSVYLDPFGVDVPHPAQQAYPLPGFAWAGKVEKVEKVDNKYPNKYAYKYENVYVKTRIGQAAVPFPPSPQSGPVTRAVRAYPNPVPPPPLGVNVNPLPRAQGVPVLRQLAAPRPEPQPARARPVYRIEAQFQVESRAIKAPPGVYSDPAFRQAQEPEQGRSLPPAQP